MSIAWLTPARRFARIACSALALLLARPGAPAAVPWDPGIVEGEFVRAIDAAADTIGWWLGGGADAWNTRYESDGLLPPQESFQPNRFVELANRGREAVRNPRILAGDRGLYYTLEEFLARVLPPDAAAPEAKALRLWDELPRRSFHRAETWPVGWYHPLIHLASFGFGECSTNAYSFARLLEAAGIPARVLGSTEHTLTEALWDGEWHVLDVDRNTFYLRADGRGLANVEDLLRDHALVRRNHTFGREAGRDDATRDRQFASFFDASVTLQLPREVGEAPSLTLRTGETLRWEWAPGPYYTDFEFGPLASGAPPPRLARAALSWRPDVLDTLWLEQAHSARAVRLVPRGETGEGLYPAGPSLPGRVQLRQTAPFLMAGGRVRLAGSTLLGASVELRFSEDGRAWNTLARIGAPGAFDFELDLEPVFDPHHRRVTNRCFLEIVLAPGGDAAGARLTGLELDLELLATADYLPALRAGANLIEYRDDGAPGARDLSLRWGWRENWESRPPAAPRLAAPADGEALRTSRPLFEWTPPADPDGDAVVDYEIMVSSSADFARPAAPGLHRYLAATAYAGQTRWRPTAPHLLVAGVPYLWRVRARDARGLWGPWSAASGFTLDLPAPVEDLALRREGKRLLLDWSAGGSGRAPASFRIYRSAVQGFEPTGETLVTETAAGEHLVNGPATGAFVRVQALDETGLDGPFSAPLELPHPFIATEPPAAARAGALFRYRPEVLEALKFDRVPYADSLRVEAIALPPWLAPSPDGRGWEGTPGPEHEGAWGMELRARDLHGGEARQRFVLRVAGEDGGVEAGVPLDAGWTLAAWNVTPLEPPGAGLLGPPADPPLAVRVFAGAAPGAPPVESARPLEGEALPADGVMLVRADSPGGFAVRGVPLDPPAAALALAAGWNLVAFPGAAPDSLRHALASVEAQLLAVTALDEGPRIWSAAHPEEATLALLRPGRAYAVKLAAADTLRFPGDTAVPLADALAGATPRAADPFESEFPVAWTPRWSWLRAGAVAQADGAPWPAATPAAVLGAGGAPLARTRLGAGGRLPFTALPGDDPATPEREGATAGEPLTLLVGGASLALPGGWQGGEILDAAAEGPLAGGAHPASLAIAGVWPNPAREGAFFECALDGAEPASVSLFDVSGRLVRRLEVAALAPRHGSVFWDGRDAAGRAAPPGVYLARLAQGGRVARAKFLLAR